MPRKKYQGYKPEEIINCNWVDFNKKIMDPDTDYKSLEGALKLEQDKTYKRETFIRRLKLRLGQLKKEETLSSL